MDLNLGISLGSVAFLAVQCLPIMSVGCLSTYLRRLSFLLILFSNFQCTDLIDIFFVKYVPKHYIFDAIANEIIFFHFDH